MVIDYKDCLSPGKFCSKCAISLASKGSKLKEIIASDSALRKAEIEEFLMLLSTTKQGLTDTLNSLMNRCDDIENYYSKQIEKTTFIMNTIQQLIDQERLKAVEFLNKAKYNTIEEIKRYEYQSQNMLEEIDDIHSDIEKNMDNIVKNIDIQPFNDIISRYKQKLNTSNSHVDQVKSQYVVINKLPPFKISSIEAIKPLIIAMYHLLESKTALIRSNQNRNYEANDSSIRKNMEDVHQNLNKSSLYISFDNKEMFANAITSSKQEEVNKKNIKSEEVMYSNANESAMSAYHNRGNVNENRSKTLDLNIKNGGFDDFINPKTERKSPKCNRRVNNYFLNNTVDNGNGNGISRVTSTSHIKSMKYGKSQQNLITDNDNAERQFDTNLIQIEQLHNNNTCFHISPQQPQEENKKESEDNQCTKKYMNILDKINANQTLKSAYYSNITQNNPLISTLNTNSTNVNNEDIVAEEEEDEDCNKSFKDLKVVNSKQKCKKKRKGLNETLNLEDNAKLSFYNIHKENGLKSDKTKDNYEMNENDDNILAIKSDQSRIMTYDDDNSYPLNEYSNSNCKSNIADIKITDTSLQQLQEIQQQKVLNDYENFYMFIENNDKKNHMSMAYQKTLFSSPNFKII